MCVIGNLQQVERNCRTLKTGPLVVRTIFLRKAARTKAHVCIALLALKRRQATRLSKSHFASAEPDPVPSAAAV